MFQFIKVSHYIVESIYQSMVLSILLKKKYMNQDNNYDKALQRMIDAIHSVCEMLQILQSHCQRPLRQTATVSVTLSLKLSFRPLA